MSTSLLLDKYRANIIIGILEFSSLKDVKSNCKKAVDMLQKKHIGTAAIVTFIDRVVNQLQKVKDATQDTVKWDKIAMAVLVLSELKSRL